MENKVDLSTVNHWVIARDSGNSGDSTEAPAVELTAKDIYDGALRYFEWCESHPIKRPEMIKTTGEAKSLDIPRAFNIPALCLHCKITVQYFKEIARNRDNEPFFLVAQWILQVIYAQKFEMAMAGVFNPVLAAKDLKIGEQEAGGKTPAVIQVYTIEGETPKLLEDEYQISLPKKKIDENGKESKA